MSFPGLNNALSGLRVAQQQLDVISNNVSNVSTPGYTRKVLPQETSVLQDKGAGVRASTIIRNVDMNLQRDLWTQVSTTSFYDVQAGYMNQIQEFHGPPDKELSISAELARLRDSFIELANAPDDNLLLKEVVNGAVATAQKFNDFSTLMTQMRNDAQNLAEVSVARANDLMTQIGELNKQIKSNIALGRSAAAMEDQRDIAIKALSEEIQITSFTRGDGVLVVQTRQGQQLVDDTVTPLYFNANPVGSNSYYPDSAAGLYIGGNPQDNRSAFDITSTAVGGKIGAYLEMRDKVLPEYQAQLDEMAHKLATRFEAQGVRMFVNNAGSVPSNADPVPNPPGPLSPVAYVGFANEIRVNPDIINNNDLIRTSTITGVNVQPGSSEFLRRIVDFTFGEFEYMNAVGNVDLRVSGVPSTLQDTLGLNPQARVVGTVNIRGLSSSTDLNVATDNPFLPIFGPPLLDDFTLRFDSGGANDTGDITIDLTAVATAYPIPPAISGADALVTYINNDIIATLAPPLNTTINAQLNQFGQLIINSQHSITIGSGNMGAAGLEYLGLSAGTTPATSPYFDVQVGKDNLVRVSIDPGDTEVDLLTKLNTIPGVVATIDATTGFLTVRPGPDFGGDIKLIDGPVFGTSGVSAVQTLFGSSSPVTGVRHPSFRQTNLGPGANIQTGIASSSGIVDFSQKMISAQTEDINFVESRQADEKSYTQLLDRQFLDESGVNLDEELSQLIIVQTAYNAAAKTISALDEMFQALLDAF